MINACNDCGNAIEECDCRFTAEVEISDQRIESVREENGNLIIEVSARVKGVVESIKVSGTLSLLTPEEENAIGKATYEAYQAYFVDHEGLPEFMEWQYLPQGSQVGWIAAGLAARRVVL